MANTTFSGPVLAQNGLQLPSFTNSQILSIPNPETGLLVFNSTNNTTVVYTGTIWVNTTPSPVPTVSAISPNSGFTTGGTNVTITGTNFVDVVTVTIGGTPVSSYVVVSPTSITAVTGSSPAVGVESVDVTNAGGTNVPNTLFTYNAPGPVTYAAPVAFQTAPTINDFAVLQVSPGAPASMVLGVNQVRWNIQANYQTLLAQPVGTVYTVISSTNVTWTLTQTSLWGPNGPYFIATVTGSNPGGQQILIKSISFTP